jgi:hypothetical protein
MDPAEGRDRDGNVIQPHFVVNVESAFSKKREMLACHESQRKWLQEHHHMDNYLETMEQWTRSRGALAGFQFGEGFRQYGCHPYPTTPALQDTLGGLIRKTTSA